MREALRNLFEMNPQNLILEVYVGLALIWIMVLVAGLWSILTSRTSGWIKAFWALVIIALPLVGVLAYAFFSALQLDFRLLTNRAKTATQAQKQKGRGIGPDSLGIAA